MTQVILYPQITPQDVEVTAAIFGVDQEVPIVAATLAVETLEQLAIRASLEQVPFAVCCPSPEALVIYGIDAIARRDVPAGLPYLICDVADIPASTVDYTTFKSGIGNSTNTWD